MISDSYNDSDKLNNSCYGNTASKYVLYLYYCINNPHTFKPITSETRV